MCGCWPYRANRVSEHRRINQHRSATNRALGVDCAGAEAPLSGWSELDWYVLLVRELEGLRSTLGGAASSGFVEPATCAFNLAALCGTPNNTLRLTFLRHGLSIRTIVQRQR